MMMEPIILEGSVVHVLRPNIILANSCKGGKPSPHIATMVHLADTQGNWEYIGLIRRWKFRAEWSFGGGRDWDATWGFAPSACDALNSLLRKSGAIECKHFERFPSGNVCYKGEMCNPSCGGNVNECSLTCVKAEVALTGGEANP